MIKTVFFFRKSFPGYHSIEELFGNIINHLPDDIIGESHVSTYQSKGFFKRLYNVIEASFHQKDINHITGDIHYIAYLLRKQKTILTIHDLEVVKRSNPLKRSLFLFFWFYIPVKRVRYITVISEFTKKELMKYIRVPADKIKVIPDCNPGHIDYSPKPFYAEYPTILQIGTKAHKNIPNLIEAIKNIPCNLILIGALDASLAELLKWNRIDYENYVDLEYKEVIDIYRRSDILAFVSTYEGFGLPILEAQSMGRPIVTGNVASMPEVAGNGALLVDPYDIKAIRDAIKQIIHDEQLRDQLIANGLENVKRFSATAVAEEYARLYREMEGEKN
jgi:glycosyltransferase involved in cell wall biosynthesis